MTTLPDEPWAVRPHRVADCIKYIVTRVHNGVRQYAEDVNGYVIHYKTHALAQREVQKRLDQIGFFPFPMNAYLRNKDELIAFIKKAQTLLKDEPPSAGPDAESKAMFVARLERMYQEGERWIVISAVLALLNDCDMLATRGTQP